MDRKRLEAELGRPLDGMSDEQVEAAEMEWINAGIADIRVELRREREARIAAIGLEAADREAAERHGLKQAQRAERVRARYPTREALREAVPKMDSREGPDGAAQTAPKD